MNRKANVVLLLIFVLSIILSFNYVSSANTSQSLIADFAINTDSGADCIGGSPSMVYDGENFFTVWVKASNIYGARVSKDGTVLDPDGISISYGLNENTSYRQPSVGFDGTNYLVVWAATRSGKDEIYGCRVTKSGKVLDPGGIKITNNGDVYIKPVGIAFDGTNYLLIWRTNSSLVMGTRVSPDGVAIDDPVGFKIADNGYYPSVVFDNKDNIYLVVWHQGAYGSLIVCGARVDTSGNVLDPDNFVICDDPMDKEYARTAFDGTNFMVIWYDWRPDSSKLLGSCYGTRVTPEGAVLDKPAFKVADRVRGEIFPNFIFDGTNYVAVWSTDSYAANKFRLSDVYSTRISTDGQVLDKQAIPVSTAFEHQFGPSIAYGDNKYLVAWSDSRSTRTGGNCALYASIFDKGMDSMQILFEEQALPDADWACQHLDNITEVYYGTAFNADDAYFFSDYSYLKFNNNVWSDKVTVEFPQVYAGFQAGDNKMCVSGWAACIRYFDGTNWNFVSDQGISNIPLITGMWGTSTNDIWASLSYSNKFIHFDGVKWNDFPQATAVDVEDISGIDGSNIYTVGEKGTIQHYDGTQWALVPDVPTVQTLNALWIADKNDIFAVGDFGTILHFDGSEWKAQTTCTYSHLKDIWGFNGSDVYAVGFDGTILHYDGTKWSLENCNSHEDLLTVFGGFSKTNNTGTVWAAGNGADVFQKSKEVVRPVTPQPTETPTPTIPVATLTPVPIVFSDLDSVTWASDQITFLANLPNPIISGIGDNKFDPNGNVTRAQFAKMIVNLEGKGGLTASSIFSDVSADKWYYNFVSVAYHQGYISGYPDGTFGPDDNISRQDMAVILARALGLTPADKNSSLAQFSDASGISSYAGDAVAACVEAGLVKGMGDGTFNPIGDATRAQAAVMIKRAYDRKT